ncbi:response regulator [Collinsella bouchesdurhonensis]|uniref:response regulator n=1 Tax=Collinsella bouchesdurhonensis TaxID=1907654 RepID=UPI00096A8839|nr:response regulator transcription factor [Collinsella bouchesdurhonensis]
MPIESHAKILVVEDDATVRNLVLTALEAQSFDLLAESTGRGAIASAATNAPDVVLLDLGLPDIDGIEVVRAIRVWSQMPIIVVSARSEDADKIVALDAGADDYLTKPFSVGELQARIRTTLRRSSYLSNAPMRESSTFENGDLRIDYSAGVAYLSGEELHLTPIEYKLLCLLSHNVDRVLTHSFILNEVWGAEHQADLASLRVFMGTLRKKIESDPAHPRYIQTHVGVGYRMIRATAAKD